MAIVPREDIMTYRNTAIGLITAVAIAAAPIAPAMARGWDHHGGWGRGGGYYHGGGGGGLLFGLAAAGGAVLGAAATLATAPFAIVANAAAPGPVYAAPGYPAPG